MNTYENEELERDLVLTPASTPAVSLQVAPAAELAEAVQHEEPRHGGSYVRDPATGALTQVEGHAPDAAQEQE